MTAEIRPGLRYQHQLGMNPVERLRALGDDLERFRGFGDRPPDELDRLLEAELPGGRAIEDLPLPAELEDHGGRVVPLDRPDGDRLYLFAVAGILGGIFAAGIGVLVARIPAIRDAVDRLWSALP